MNQKLPLFNLSNRETLLQKATSISQYDIVVIGGGATGLGIAREAVFRGYKVLLLEQSDFAKGTSSKSTKLVHGGVRYLAQGDLKLVKEACHERFLLLKNAPHLVQKQSFIVPVYNNWDALKYSIGLKIYDAVAGKESLGNTAFISKADTLKALPKLKSSKLKGGVRYYDGQFNDSRLANNLLQQIFQHGGMALNYCRVTGINKNTSGKIESVQFLDEETKKTYTVSCKVLVNATGVFVDDVLKMENAERPETIAISQGIHLVVDRKFLPGSDAIMIPKTSDGRVLFMIPWQGKVLMGTTDTLVEKATLEPTALDKEINFILQTAANYLQNPPTKADVLSIFSGLRPLAKPNNIAKTKEISRSHKIVSTESNLFTMLGGKWTTFRRMAEDMINEVENKLQWQKTVSLTAEALYPKPDYEIVSDWNPQTIDDEIEFAVNYEMARTVDDFLSRRKRLLLLDADTAVNVSAFVAEKMAVILNRDNHWIEEQKKAFLTIAAHYKIDPAFAAPQR